MQNLDPQLAWMLDALEAPIAVAVFWMLHKIRSDLDRRVERGDSKQADGLSRTREDLAAFKIEVARTYVPLSLIRDVDRRLTEHLVRIERQLSEMREDGK